MGEIKAPPGSNSVHLCIDMNASSHRHPASTQRSVRSFVAGDKKKFCRSFRRVKPERPHGRGCLVATGEFKKRLGAFRYAIGIAHRVSVCS